MIELRPLLEFEVEAPFVSRGVQQSPSITELKSQSTNTFTHHV